MSDITYTPVSTGGGGGGSPTGPAGGSLSGTYPNPTVLKVGAGSTTVTTFGESVAGAADADAGRAAMALGNSATLDVGTTAGTVAAGDDSRFTNARTPTAHAATHVNGTDDIQSATASQKGLATAAQITKLDGIEALADVTDAANVGSSIDGASAVTTLNDTDKIPVTVAGTLSNIAYSAFKTLLNAIYALKGATTGSGLTMATNKLLGRGTAGTGAIEEITLGTNLSLSGTTLNASGGGGLTNITETLHTASPNNTVNAEQLEVTGGTTNTHLVLTPKGVGAFIVGQEPDGTSTGGNVPGESAIQISTVRDAASQVASGKRSIVIGSRSTASVQSGIAIGANAEATGNPASIAIGGNEGNYTATCSAGGLAIHGSSTAQNAVAIGRSTSASAVGGAAIGDGASATNSWMTYSNGNGFGGGVSGNIQSVTGGLLAVTTNATPTTMTFARYVSSFLSIPSGFVMVATCVVSCASSSGASLGAFTRRVIIKNVSGTTTLVQSQTMGTDYEDDAGLDVTITADDTNDRLKIEVTGIAATTYRWSADVRGIVYQIGT